MLDSPMADRATRQVPDAGDVVFPLQADAKRELIGGGFIGHVEKFSPWPAVLFGRSMTVQAPLHLERLRLIRERHLVNRTVARRAADPLTDMNLVIEINEI